MDRSCISCTVRPASEGWAIRKWSPMAVTMNLNAPAQHLQRVVEPALLALQVADVTRRAPPARDQRGGPCFISPRDVKHPGIGAGTHQVLQALPRRSSRSADWMRKLAKTVNMGLRSVRRFNRGRPRRD